jgi:SAM-dependent methyltransferase
VPEPLAAALADLRTLLTDSDRLVRAVAAGRRRGVTPEVPRVELRPVRIGAGPRLQIVEQDAARPRTRNVAWGADAEAAVAELLARPYGNWHVTGTDATVQLRVTKRGEAQVHRSAGAGKRRQVDAFLRVLQAAVADAAPDLPADRPLHVVDLGCGNAYLSFAAYRFLADGRNVRLTGVDQRPEMRERNSAIADQLGWSDRVRFVAGSIAGSSDDLGDVDIVLALHACDTATDDALAQAVHARATVVLASPCCHHDMQRQMSASRAPSPYGLVARHSILRERLGDVLTDAVRAALLRRMGYQVDVVQFVSAEYTPRNTMIRAVRQPGGPPPGADADYDELVASWGVTPHLQTLLTDDLAGRG